MRILVLAAVYPPYKGGMGAVAAQEVHLARAAGYDVRVLTPKYTKKALQEQTNVMFAPVLFAWGNGAIVSWKNLFSEIQKAEVVHLHYPFYGTAFPALLIAKFLQKHCVLTYHMHAHARDWRQIIFSLHRFFIEPLILFLADAVCVSSKDYAKAQHVHHSHLIEVPFGIDPQRFFPAPASAWRETYGYSEDETLFLFVGGMDTAHTFKGIPTLLQAAIELPTNISWRILLVGDGDLRKSYEELARRLGIGDRVHFLGSVPFADLPEVYRANDVHVLPSTSVAEAFGLVILEAAASGKPSIVSDLPGVRSVILAEKTGLLVPPGDAIALAQAMIKLLSDRELRRNFGEAARERVLAKYTLEQEWKSLKKAYL